MRIAAGILCLTLGACQSPSATPQASHAERLVGTWATTEGPQAEVTYASDGTWTSRLLLEVEGQGHEFHGSGTWKVVDGAIHNNTLVQDPIPGMEDLELPYLSIEKLVAVKSDEYRYVCPVQGCTNTMRRVEK